MSTPEDIAPERVEQLLAGAPPRDEAERDLLALFARVRAAEPPAPDALRARIAALGDPAPAGPLARLRAAVAGAGSAATAAPRSRARRRLVALGAPVAAAALAAALVLPAVLRSDGPADEVPAAGSDSGAVMASPGAAAPPAPERQAAPAAPAADDSPADEGIVPAQPAPVPGRADAGPQEPPAAAPATLALTLTLRLRAEAGSPPAALALRARALVVGAGGNAGVPRAVGDGRIRLAARIPVAALDRTADRLARLGTALGREGRTRDLAPAIAAARARAQADPRAGARELAALRARARSAALVLDILPARAP